MSQATQSAAAQPPSYEPFGWHQWHDDFWMSYQFRRGLGETQEGGGAVSEVFQAASKIIPNDFESWYREWTHIAERNDLRGDQEIDKHHVRSAMNCWLRAANYFREAEFWLKPNDPRRLATFDQGGALRRHGLVTRPDYEVPIGKCIDWLEKRNDIDTARIAVSGSSLGGYYAARAGAMEPRLAACISHGAIWDIHERWKTRDENHGLAGHIKWVFGAKTMAEATEIAKPFKLEGVLENMQCPYLIIHGGHDVLGVESVKQVYDYATRHGINATLRLTSEEETGAEHCQHDNPTLGQELMIDWLADVFKIDQRKLSFFPG